MTFNRIFLLAKRKASPGFSANFVLLNRPLSKWSVSVPETVRQHNGQLSLLCNEAPHDVQDVPTSPDANQSILASRTVRAYVYTCESPQTWFWSHTYGASGTSSKLHIKANSVFHLRVKQLELDASYICIPFRAKGHTMRVANDFGFRMVSMISHTGLTCAGDITQRNTFFCSNWFQTSHFVPHGG